MKRGLTSAALGLLACWIAGSLAAPRAQADPVRIGLIDRTIYDDAVLAILKEAGFDAEITYARVDALRDMFLTGEIALDCCSIPEWRMRPEEQKIQLFSDHFFVAADHLILSRTVPAPDAKEPLNLDRYRFATVRGFTYPVAEHIRNPVPVETIEDAFMALADGRADATIFGVQEFYRLQAANPLPVVLGPVTHRYALRLRVRSDHADLLPPLNAAISKLKSKGRIDALIGSALRAGRDK